MIRTLIEVTTETSRDHPRELEATLDKLGFEPKRSEEHGRFMSDLMQALNERGLNPMKLVDELRERISDEAVRNSIIPSKRDNERESSTTAGT